MSSSEQEEAEKKNKMTTHQQLTHEAAKKIGERLRDTRKKRGLAQQDLADACDISRAAVSLWELGETTATRERLRLAARRLNVDLQWLMTGKRTKRPYDLPTGYSPSLAREMRKERNPHIPTSPSAGDITFTLIPEMSYGVGSCMTYAQADDVHGFWSLPPALTASLRVKPENLKVFPVLTNVLEPKICKGSLVFIDFAQTAPINGGIFAIDSGHSISLKIIQIDDADLSQIVVSDIIGQPQQVPAKMLRKKIIGRAVGQFSPL